jgi:hypothetical protein
MRLPRPPRSPESPTWHEPERSSVREWDKNCQNSDETCQLAGQTVDFGLP